MNKCRNGIIVSIISLAFLTVLGTGRLQIKLW